LVLGAGTVAAAAVFQLPMFGFGPQASGSTTAAPQVIEKTVYEDHYVPKQQPTGASVQRTSNAGGTSQSRPSSAGGQSATAPAGGAAPADPSQGAAAPAPA
jgi:hypothetical protein